MKNNLKTEKLETIIVSPQLPLAYIIKDMLEGAGFTVFLQNENMAQIYSNILGGVEIQVPDSEVEKAIALLKEAGY
jgi:hypothetical protein